MKNIEKLKLLLQEHETHKDNLREFLKKEFFEELHYGSTKESTVRTHTRHRIDNNPEREAKRIIGIHTKCERLSK